MDLMYEEEMAERRRQAEVAAAAKREAAKQEMMSANAGKPAGKVAMRLLNRQRHSVL